MTMAYQTSNPHSKEEFAAPSAASSRIDGSQPTASSVQYQSTLPSPRTQAFSSGSRTQSASAIYYNTPVDSHMSQTTQQRNTNQELQQNPQYMAPAEPQNIMATIGGSQRPQMTGYENPNFTDPTLMTQATIGYPNFSVTQASNRDENFSNPASTAGNYTTHYTTY